jgi:hypothetical protein
VTVAGRIDDLLRGRGEPSAEGARALGLGRLWGIAAAAGLFYGAVMGSYSGLAAGRWQQLAYSAAKVPLFLFVTYALCVPAFFVFNSLRGLRTDFRIALSAMTAMQACLAVILASLAPVTALAYLSTPDYGTAVFFNGLVFAAASVSSQIVVLRCYRPLIALDRRHRSMIAVWLTLYVFVGIQAAWVMRPFVGNPDLPVALFRPGAWGNAYVAVIRLTRQVLQ